MSFQLYTSRLRVREYTPSDVAFATTLLADPTVRPFLPGGCGDQKPEQWLDEMIAGYRRSGQGFWLVERTSDRQPLGQVGLIWQDVDGQPEPELEFMLHVPFRHHGFATEAAAAVRDFAFGELRLPYVITMVRLDDHSTQRVARRLGMTPTRQTLFHNLPHRVYQVQRHHAA